MISTKQILNFPLIEELTLHIFSMINLFLLFCHVNVCIPNLDYLPNFCFWDFLNIRWYLILII